MADSPRKRYARSPSPWEENSRSRSRSRSKSRSRSRSWSRPRARSRSRSRGRGSGRDEIGNDGCTLYVTGLSTRVTERDLEDHFSKEGKGHLACSKFESVLEFVMPYVQGLYPCIGGIAWHQVDKVYRVGHVLGTHWVVYEVLLSDQRIVIYDSLSDFGASAEIIAEFYHVARNIPILCRAGDVWRQKGWNSEDLMDVWDILYYPNPPQQINEYDCGVMCIKFMECLVSDNPLSILDPARTGLFRKIFCGHLFSHRHAANSIPP